jgi:hypothetical protein
MLIWRGHFVHNSWNYIHNTIGAAIPWSEAEPIAPEPLNRKLGPARRCKSGHKWQMRRWTRKCVKCGLVMAQDAAGRWYTDEYKD